jgi:hypothetical protein
MATEQRDKRQTKPAAAAAAAHAPWLPHPHEPADQLSIQRLAAGTANPLEQKQALKWIMSCAGYLDEPYRPGGEDGRRETDFALGKAHVGRQIAKMLNVTFRRSDNDREQP